MRLRVVVLTDGDEPPRVFNVPLPATVQPGEQIGSAVEKAAAAFQRTLTNVLQWEKRRDTSGRTEALPANVTPFMRRA